MGRTSHLVIFISIVAVAVRLILIDQPFVDHWSWRQSDVAAIARNYFQSGYHFARPQIDWAGDQPGYVGTEFPILPFIAALLYKVFGIHQWIGRLQGVILFAISLPFFFWLVRNLAGEMAALWALFFYSFAPLGIMASRCFMPDTPSLSLSIIGLYFFQCWLDDEKSTSAFVTGALCISLSILIKATGVIIAAPIACLLFQRFSLSAFRRFSLWLFALIALLPPAIWYWHAYEISLEFYPYHFFGAGGVKIMSWAWYWKLAQQVPTSTLTPVLFILGAIGALTTMPTLRMRLFHWWLGAMVLFFFVVGYGNRHPWYQLPLVPIFAAFAGLLCARIMAFPTLADRRSDGALFMRAGFWVTLISFMAFGFAYLKWFYEPTAAPMRDAGLLLKKVAEPDALIVAADNGNPTLFYYAERKGWHLLETNGVYNGEPTDSAEAIADVEKLRKQGANYLVFPFDTSWWLDYYEQLRQYVASTSTVVAETPKFKIYKLHPMSR